jgi:hypothetical protein
VLNECWLRSHQYFTQQCRQCDPGHCSVSISGVLREGHGLALHRRGNRRGSEKRFSSLGDCAQPDFLALEHYHVNDSNRLFLRLPQPEADP